MKVIAAATKARPDACWTWTAVSGKVLVEGVSMVKRHTRPNPSKQIKGGIAERESRSRFRT